MRGDYPKTIVHFGGPLDGLEIETPEFLYKGKGTDKNAFKDFGPDKDSVMAGYAAVEYRTINCNHSYRLPLYRRRGQTNQFVFDRYSFPNREEFDKCLAKEGLL